MAVRTRRELLASLGKAVLVAPLPGLFSSGVFSCRGGNLFSAPSASAYTGTDDQLLEELERASFEFFWNEASPATGLMKDRALAGGNDTRTMASIASTGFGLAGLCIADHRGYAAGIKPRVQAALEFFARRATHQHGWFYHFLDMNSGQRWGTCEVSPIDTAILLCGILTARAYFQDPAITGLANQIYQRVDFRWMLNGGSTLAMGWTPESGFLRGRWDSYYEEMMLYLLGMASPTYPLPASAWLAFSRPTVRFQDFRYIAGAAPLFTHQYSHAFFDFRDRRDAYADYFHNSIIATRAHKAFCLSLGSRFPDYSSDLWGITSSDSKGGYVGWGGPPASGPIDGTVVPAAAAGSVPFVSTDCLAVLRNLRRNYPGTWKKYGFVDAFNPLTGWYDSDVIGIDVGISMLMAENQRSGFVWRAFMQNPEARRAMTAAGFR